MSIGFGVWNALKKSKLSNDKRSSNKVNFLKYPVKRPRSESVKSSEISLDAIKQETSIMHDKCVQFLQSLEGKTIHITSLNIDVVNSSEKVKNISSKDAGDYYRTFIESMADIIQYYGGYVLKNVGDCVIGFFPCSKYIVGLSDTVISVKKQIKKIEVLNSLVSSCKNFKNADPNSMLILPTGDGMVVGFLQGPELPLRLAMELHKKLNAYNKGKSPEETLRIRIGLNDGPVYVVKDIQGNQTVWGPGIILARRVMDVGDDGHILLTPRMAETLRELSDEYKVLINS